MPERATARIKPSYSTGVMHDVSALIEHQHAIIPTVEVDERARRVKRETSRIGDPRIAAERPERFAFAVEAEDRAVAPAVGAPCAGHEEAHQVMLTRTSGGFSPAFRQEREHPARRAKLSLWTTDESQGLGRKFRNIVWAWDRLRVVGGGPQVASCGVGFSAIVGH